MQRRKVETGLEKKQELQSLKRGLKAVALINRRGSITIAQLGRDLSLPRTTAERILKTLSSEGYIERDVDTKAFVLTAQVHCLSDGYAEDNRLVDAAKPIMQTTTRDIGWPLCLATPLGEYMSVRVTTDPETALSLDRRHVGSAGSMGMVSSGLVFLAYLDDNQRRAMLEMLRQSDNPSQAVAHDAKRIAYLIEQIRENGYGFGLDHGRERSVAVPLMAHGRIKGALLMVFMARVLTNDMVVETFVPRLKAVAAEIERQAFGDQPDHLSEGSAQQSEPPAID